jgi:GAF domain-containing protein
LQLVSETALTVTESDGAAIMTADKWVHGYRLAAVSGQGAQTELARRAAAKVMATGEGLRLCLPDLPAEFARPDLASDQLSDVVALPLHAADGVTGALVVARLASRSPYPEQVEEILASFVTQTSLALQQAALHAEHRHELQRLKGLLGTRPGEEPSLAPSPSAAPSSVEGK